MLVMRPLDELVRLDEAPDPRLEHRLRRRPVPDVLGRDALASRHSLGLISHSVVVVKFHVSGVSTYL